MASQLPAFPRAIFTVIEPISLVAGFLGAVMDPAWFVAQQIPVAAVASISSKLSETAAAAESEGARLVALQLGNTYGLVCLIGLGVLNSTSEIKVVRAYLVACLIADVTHVGLTCWGLGYDRSVDYASWTATMWGNIAFTVTTLSFFSSSSPCFSPSPHPTSLSCHQIPPESMPVRPYTSLPSPHSSVCRLTKVLRMVSFPAIGIPRYHQNGLFPGPFRTRHHVWRTKVGVETDSDCKQKGSISNTSKASRIISILCI
ncbi:hypothetical protein MN608_02792 [Microdochium nivale]|nr:hypothetical protein MN608_02792 [Microdochium nivale]